MHNPVSALNPPQQTAVTLPAAHALVLAGAGSGKTRVLISRIAWLIQSQIARPHEILAVTFTNKAAKEMQIRLEGMLGIQPRGLWIGTFHGLCNRLLRLHHNEAALPETFQILDSADQLAMIRRLLKNLGIDDERYPPRAIAGFINQHKEQGLRAAQAQNLEGIPSIAKYIEIYAEYEARCQREGVVDFAELLLRAYELLRRNQPLLEHYRNRFRHILVDEFQDTNRLQYAWLKLLAAPGNDAAGSTSGEAPANGAWIFAVGDDDQSIYRFRGAEIGNMHNFEREFASGRLIRLEQNYRSHGNILAAANAVISHNHDRLGKNLWTDQGAGEPIRTYVGPSDLDEAQWITAALRQCIDEGIPRNEIAILYRSNAQSRVLEHQLFTQRIPYRVYGGLRFFERQEIKHALAYLRLIANPDDDTAFLRIVNLPTRGIGSRTIEILQQSAHQMNSSLYNVAAASTGLGGKAKTSVGAFIGLIESLRRETGSLTLPEAIDRVLTQSGLLDLYRAEKNAEEGSERLANLDELINAASIFASENPIPEQSEGGLVSAFLAHASLEAGEHQAGESEEAVQLMTVHAAKGLEFSAVFVSGLEQGLFPHENALSDPGGEEEERRLFYVALTRARRHLSLSHAQTRMLHGELRYCRPSAFLDDIPAELLESSFKPSRTPAWSGYADKPARAPGRDNLEGGLRIGQNVRHARFGEGTIIAAEGRGDDARVQVNFAQNGSKWLQLSLAKLESL